MEIILPDININHNMKRHSILLALILLCVNIFPGRADTTTINNEEDLHRFVQYENTCEALKNYFTEKKIDSESSFLVAVILPPMACPRCEGLISPFLNDLEKIDSSLTTAIFTFYSKSKPAYKYLLERRYPADDFYLFTSNEFLENFYLSANGIQVPFFVKFNIRTGDLILSKSTLGLEYDTNVAEAFSKAIKPIKKYKKELSPNNMVTNGNLALKFNIDSLASSDENFLGDYKIFTVLEDKEFILSEMKRISFSGDGKRFSFMDDLTNSIGVYSIENEQYRFVRNIRAGDYEDKLFFEPDLGDVMFLFMKKMNILNSMYFNSKIFGDSLIISASLPEVFFEDKEAEEIAYMNKVVFLIKSINYEDMNSYVTLDTNFSSIILNHTNARFFPAQNKIFIPITKGWPVSGVSSLPVNPEENPFIPQFYDFTPAYAIFDMEGKFQSLAGTIDSVHIFNKLGYTFFNPLIKFCNNNFWMADSYAGAIMKLDLVNNEICEKISLFTVPENLRDINLGKDCTLEYFKVFNTFLNTIIVDFEIINDKVISIIKSGDFNLLSIYDRKTKNIEVKKIIPNKIGEYNSRSLHLHTSGEISCLMGVYESSTKSAIVKFTINQ